MNVNNIPSQPHFLSENNDREQEDDTNAFPRLKNVFLNMKIFKTQNEDGLIKLFQVNRKFRYIVSKLVCKKRIQRFSGKIINKCENERDAMVLSYSPLILSNHPHAQTLLESLIYQYITLYINEYKDNEEINKSLLNRIHYLINTGTMISNNPMLELLLDQAIEKEAGELISFLVSLEIPVNGEWKTLGEWLLYRAIFKQNMKMALLLIKSKKVRIDHPDFIPTFFKNVEVSKIKAVKFFLQKEPSLANCIHPEKMVSPIFVAVEKNNIEMLQLFDRYNANFLQRDEMGRTVLHQAILNSSVQMVTFLTKKKALLNLVDNYDCSPLAYALSSCRYKKDNISTEIFSELLKAGAEPNQLWQDHLYPSPQPPQEHTLFYFVARSGEDDAIKLAEMLLEAGIQIDRNDGFSPLFYAVQFENRSLIKWLINNGANLQAKNKDGKTVEEVAKELGYDDIAEQLHELTELAESRR